MKKKLILNISGLLGIILFAIACIYSTFADKYYPYLFIIGLLLFLIPLFIYSLKISAVKAKWQKELNISENIDEITIFNTQQQNELYIEDSQQDIYDKEFESDAEQNVLNDIPEEISTPLFDLEFELNPETEQEDDILVQ